MRTSLIVVLFVLLFASFAAAETFIPVQALPTGFGKSIEAAGISVPTAFYKLAAFAVDENHQPISCSDMSHYRGDVFYIPQQALQLSRKEISVAYSSCLQVAVASSKQVVSLAQQSANTKQSVAGAEKNTISQATISAPVATSISPAVSKISKEVNAVVSAPQSAVKSAVSVSAALPAEALLCSASLFPPEPARSWWTSFLIDYGLIEVKTRTNPRVNLPCSTYGAGIVPSSAAKIFEGYDRTKANIMIGFFILMFSLCIWAANFLLPMQREPSPSFRYQESLSGT